MKTLTIFYDPRCGMCTAFRQWLQRQVKTVRTEFVDYAGADASRIFPGIENMHADEEIVVLANDGRWWQGSSAWLVCLWTTVEYRAWSYRLAAPSWQPFIKRLIHGLSMRRHVISQMLRLPSETQLRHELQAMGDEACATGNCHVPRSVPPALPTLAIAKASAQSAFADKITRK